MASTGRGSVALLLGILLSPYATAQVTQRVSVANSGVAANADSYWGSVSPDGRYVAFKSFATNLVPDDTNGTWDIFVRDRQSGMTERVSLDSNEVQGNGQSECGWISSDGRYLSFWSWATNLVPGDTNGTLDVFVRDRSSGTTERVSIASGGAQGNDYSVGGHMTPDGRYVVFVSHASNLVAGSPPGTDQVFVRDRQSGTTEIVSLTHSGGMPNGWCYGSTISADGRYVAFVGEASNLVPGDTNHDRDIFVRDRQNGTTERINVASDGTQAFGSGGFDVDAAISANGRYVVFTYGASNLVPGDTNTTADIFVRDLLRGTTERVSLDSNGIESNGESVAASISSDGRFVGFTSRATNLVTGDSNGTKDVFVRDRRIGTTERISVDSAGVQGNDESGAIHISSSMDGRYVVFYSVATNLVPGDVNQEYDIYLRDRQGGTSFSPMCDPGVSGVLPCPCSNSPSELGRGCDNSSSTGGAALAASGGTYLSSDSLVFTTNGEKPTALSIVSQWTGFNSNGVVFGQGVRCTSGTLKRLYTKTASDGSITAPNFGAGDPQVSVRSATLGDTISAGQSRWYLVYYRDPIVLGGCPASSTFNCTQTGQVTWAP